MVRRVGRPEGLHYTCRLQRDADDLSYIDGWLYPRRVICETRCYGDPHRRSRDLCRLLLDVAGEIRARRSATDEPVEVASEEGRIAVLDIGPVVRSVHAES